MIEFRTDSWHYRAADLFSSFGPPKSLCPYVRAVLFGGLLWTAAITVVLYIVIADLFALALFVQGYAVDGLTDFFRIPVFITLLSGIVCGLTWAAVTYRNYQDDKRHREYEAAYQAKYGEGSGNYVPPQPSLFRLYWNAVHDKLCPMIEFKDSDKPKTRIEPTEPWPED